MASSNILNADRVVKIKEGVYVSKNQKNWFEKVLRYDSTNKEALRELAEHCKKSNNIDKAIKVYARLSKMGDSNSLYQLSKLQKVKQKRDRAAYLKLKEEESIFSKRWFQMMFAFFVVFLVLSSIIALYNGVFKDAESFYHVIYAPEQSNVEVSKNPSIMESIKSRNIIAEEENYYLFYGDYALSELGDNYYSDDIFIERTMDINALVSEKGDVFRNVIDSAPAETSRVLIDVKGYTSGEILYSIIWDRKNPRDFDIYKKY